MRTTPRRRLAGSALPCGCPLRSPERRRGRRFAPIDRRIAECYQSTRPQPRPQPGVPAEPGDRKALARETRYGRHRPLLDRTGRAAPLRLVLPTAQQARPTAVAPRPARKTKLFLGCLLNERGPI